MNSNGYIICAIVPAREGSKRLVGKNKKILGGKPLICWTIEEAIKCDFIDYILVSTDDEDILKICTRYFDEQQSRLQVIPRPKEYAQDDTPYHPVVIHALKEVKTLLDRELRKIVVIYLQPTSPLRTRKDILSTWSMYKRSDMYHPVVSVHYKKGDHNIRINGAIYIDNALNIYYEQSFIRTGMMLYKMSEERSLDIDTQDDWEKAEKYIEEMLNEHE